MRKKWRAIRCDSDGRIDDVAIDGDLFRMEQLNDTVWWIAIYRGKKIVSFTLSAKSPIVATLQEDNLGCIDDTA